MIDGLGVHPISGRIHRRRERARVRRGATRVRLAAVPGSDKVLHGREVRFRSHRDRGRLNLCPGDRRNHKRDRH